MSVKKGIIRSLILVFVVAFAFPIFVNAKTGLQEAIDSAKNGSTIQLDDDYEEAITINADKQITVDLNGHNITVTEANVDAISNYGLLTIKGTGSVTAKGAAITNYPGAKATLDNGNYLSNGWYTIKNMGTMIINNMRFGNNVNNGASLIDNGFVGSKKSDRDMVYDSSKPVSMIINGGTFENKNNSCNVVKNDDYGNLVINGGTFIANSDSTTNANPVVQNWNKAVINNGTFTSNNGIVLANGALDQVADVGELTIKGGTYTGKKGIFGTNGSAKAGLGVLTIEDGTFTGDATLSTVYKTVIKGGIFTDNVKPSEGYNAYSVIGENKVIVAKESDLVEKLDINKVNADDIKEDAKLIRNTIKENQVIAAYYNIDLFKTYEGFKLEQVTSSNEKVKVTIDIPSDIEKVKDGFKRTYYVIKVHDEKATVLTAIDNNNGTVTFETDEFSSYALVYTDEKTSDTSSIKNPKTFDNTLFFIITFVVSLTGVVLGVKYVKKHTK